MSKSSESLIAEAEKRAKGGFWASLKGGPKYEEAGDLYVEAGNQYKIASRWKEAGECFAKAADMYSHGGDNIMEAHNLVDSGDCYKKVSLPSAAEKYRLASQIYTKMGRFNQAGRLYKSLAESFAQDADYQNAKDAYDQAAKHFSLDELSKSMYTQSINQYADLSARLDSNYDEAIKIYEKEGEKALRNSLTQFSAKEYFTKAAILHMVKGDGVTTTICVEKYCDLDPRLKESREGKMILALCSAIENKNLDAFTEALEEYDRITRLDAWKVFFLTKVKETMEVETGVTTTHHDMMPPAQYEVLPDGTVDLT